MTNFTYQDYPELALAVEQNIGVSKQFPNGYRVFLENLQTNNECLRVALSVESTLIDFHEGYSDCFATEAEAWSAGLGAGLDQVEAERNAA